jgi:hypothetical protein
MFFFLSLKNKAEITINIVNFFGSSEINQESGIDVTSVPPIGIQVNGNFEVEFP